jgi:urea-proton symporter
MISQTAALAIVSTFGVAMVATSAIRRRAGGLDLFLLADRSVGTVVGAMSVASTWIWAPALFLASQKAFQQGLPGLMWFTVPNVACLVLFAFLASRIRDVFPRGYTLPQYIASRFDAKTHLVYLFSFLALQVCSLGVQLIAGAALLNAMSGAPYFIGVIVLAVMFTSYSLIDGLKSSIRTDLIQMLIIVVGMAVLVPLAVVNGGGLETVKAGLGGFSGKYGNLFDAHVAYTFGITVTIGLMSGPVGDQQHWQRAFAFQKGKEFKGYLLGALIFALVPLTMSLLGFIAAGNHGAAPAVLAGQVPAQQVGPEVIRNLLPAWGLIAFMLMILSGLASTGDSALCAGGSLLAVDIYRRYVNPKASDDRVLVITRLAVLGIALGAVGIALIPGITVLSLFLFYGTLRSSTLMPTLVVLFKEKVKSWGVFWGVGLAICFGLPMYLYGELSGNVDLKVAANIAIVLISLIFPLFSCRLPLKEHAADTPELR